MAKRFTKSSIVWADMEKRVLAAQKTNFYAFKAKSDAYLRRVLSSPPELPEIDWASYQKSVPVPGLVDKFKSAYAALKVPFPDDPLTSSIDAEWAKIQTEIKDFCAKSDKIIEETTKELERIKSLPKYDEMTMEVYYEMYPEMALDTIKNPTLWPHNAEEQLGFYSEAELAAMKEAQGH